MEIALRDIHIDDAFSDYEYASVKPMQAIKSGEQSMQQKVVVYPKPQL